VNIVTTLLALKADINAGDLKQGMPPIHLAMCSRNMPMTQALLEAHADIERRNNFMNTALLQAAYAFSEVIPTLLAAKANVHVVNALNLNALSNLALDTCLEPVMASSVLLLLAAKADLNGCRGLFTESCRWRTIQKISRGVVFCGSTKTMFRYLALSSTGAMSPLVTSIFLNNPAYAKVLLDASADQHAIWAGRTPVEHARMQGRTCEAWQQLLLQTRISKRGWTLGDLPHTPGSLEAPPEPPVCACTAASSEASELPKPDDTPGQLELPEPPQSPTSASQSEELRGMSERGHHHSLISTATLN